MNYISSIRIRNIKGWDDHKFCFDNRSVVPNKAHILVAPNGFGKSSLAIAFKSLQSNRINLAEKNFYKCNPALEPEIQIRYFDGEKDQLLQATSSKNNISSLFDVSVLNSPLQAKAIKQNHGKYTTAISSMKIEPIILESKIPKQSKFSYKITTVRNHFSRAFAAFLHNMETCLVDKSFVLKINNWIPWHELSLVKIQKLFKEIEQEAENAGITEDSYSMVIQRKVSQVPIIQQVLERIVQGVDSCSYLKAFSILIQFSYLSKNKKEYEQVIEWYEYSQRKLHYEHTIKDFNSSWNSILPKEEKGKLVVNFPDADYLSNGQRDLLFLVLKLMKEEQTLRKDKCILIIDELFDYLDDANLVAFQYYVSRMIQRFREQKRELYPFLLTHLDPKLFSHFRLAKMNICYLDESSFDDDMHLSTLIENRADSRIKSYVDKHLFHYCPIEPEEDYSQEFAELKIKKVYSNKSNFHKLVLQEVKNYLMGHKANPFAICIAMRVKIEYNIYNKLSDGNRNEFLNTNKTDAKLRFASELEIEIPEIYFLLGIIYNSPLHPDKEKTNIMWNRLQRNLKNPAIKKMIDTLFSET